MIWFDVAACRIGFLGGFFGKDRIFLQELPPEVPYSVPVTCSCEKLGFFWARLAAGLSAASGSDQGFRGKI